MANGNDYSQYTQGMTEAQANEFARLAEIYNTRFQRQGARPDMEGLEAEELTLSDYSQDIQNILRDDRYSQIVDSSKRRAMDKMLSDYGFEAAPYFDANPTATSIDVMRATNFNGFADKEKRYSDPSTFTNESGRSKAKEELYNEYESTFQNSFLFPELGSGLRDIVPDYIKNDPEKMADFESAFYYETGGAKIDFDESGRIGGVYTDSSVGNFMREGGYKVVDVGNQFVEWAATTSNTLYSILGGDLDKKNKEFLKRQEEGEIETEFQRLERGRSEGVGFNDPIFWASFTSPEARQQLLRSSSGLRTVDFNAMMDRQRILGQIGQAQQSQTAGMATMLQGLQGLGDTALSAGLEREKIKAGYYGDETPPQGKKEKGGTIEKTPGEFSHEKNPIDVVQDGTKIAEMTGGEYIFNPEQMAAIKKLVASNEGNKLHSYMKSIIKKFEKKAKA